MTQLSPEKRFLYAVEDGNSEEFQELLGRIDVQTTNAAGASPLHLAVLHSRLAMAARLLAAKANPDALDAAHRTPLHWAAAHGNTAIAKLLLEHGATVDAVDRHGNTALWTAVLRPEADLAFVQLLLRHGAQPRLKNKHGKSAYQQAVEMEAKELQQLLERDGGDA